MTVVLVQLKTINTIVESAKVQSQSYERKVYRIITVSYLWSIAESCQDEVVLSCK